MIYKILFNNKLPFPHISSSLFLSCLIISVPILLDDVLYAFLGANVGLAFPWQYLTSVFAHGPEPPLLIHLIFNLLIIIICIALTEKLIGSWWVFLIFVLTSVNFTIIRFETLNFYNGISIFIFAFAPFTFFVLLIDYKNNGKEVWVNLFNILALFLLFCISVLYPIYFSIIDSIFCQRNLLLMFSIIIGVIFVVLWRKRILNFLVQLSDNTLPIIKQNIWDKICRILGYVITGVNILSLIVVLIFFG